MQNSGELQKSRSSQQIPSTNFNIKFTASQNLTLIGTYCTYLGIWKDNEYGTFEARAIIF